MFWHAPVHHACEYEGYPKSLFILSNVQGAFNVFEYSEGYWGIDFVVFFQTLESSATEEIWREETIWPLLEAVADISTWKRFQNQYSKIAAMGRKKIQISRITDERNRQVSFIYPGLFPCNEIFFAGDIQ